MNDTKKQTAAPIKQPPKPSSLTRTSSSELNELIYESPLHTYPISTAQNTPPPRSTSHLTSKARNHSTQILRRCRTAKRRHSLVVAVASRLYCHAPSEIGTGYHGRIAPLLWVPYEGVRSRGQRIFTADSVAEVNVCAVCCTVKSP